MQILEEKIRNANREGRCALIPFLTAGFPDTNTFWPTVTELDENGADIIEIGVPFSDPVADGPVVEEASRLALSEGVRLETILRELQEKRRYIEAGIVLMGYYNPFLQYGLSRLVEDCEMAGVNGLIVPDLPYDEAEMLRSLAQERDIALIPLVGPNTSLERMRLYGGEAMGYAYVVSVMGVTGERKSLSDEVAETLSRARKAFQVPLALGFGLKEPSQLKAMKKEEQPDAVVFGSALLRHLKEGKPVYDFMGRWRSVE